MGCGDGDVLMALPPFPPFTDGCNGDTWNLFFRHSTDWVHTCEVGNGTLAAGAERTMRLVGLTSSGLVTSDLFVVTGAGLTLVSQCRFNDQFRVGYMRDVATTDIQSCAGGTHEVFLGWSFETSKPRIAMPQGM